MKIQLKSNKIDTFMDKHEIWYRSGSTQLLSIIPQKAHPNYQHWGPKTLHISNKKNEIGNKEFFPKRVVIRVLPSLIAINIIFE